MENFEVLNIVEEFAYTQDELLPGIKGCEIRQWLKDHTVLYTRRYKFSYIYNHLCHVHLRNLICIQQ
jgi:hypothetical protein